MTTMAILRPTDRKEESVELAPEDGVRDCFRIAHRSEDERFAGVRVASCRELSYGDVDIVVLTSSTAVKSTFELAQKHGQVEELSRGLRQAQVIAIGPVTARTAEKEWIKVDTLPEKFTSKGLVQLLSKKGCREAGGDPEVRSRFGRADERSGRLGATVQEIEVYKLTKVKAGRPLLDMFYKGSRGDRRVRVHQLDVGKIVHRGGEEALSDEEVEDMLDCAIIAAIGEPTKKTLEDLGVRVDIMPAKATFEDLLKAIKEGMSTEQSAKTAFFSSLSQVGTTIFWIIQSMLMLMVHRLTGQEHRFAMGYALDAVHRIGQVRDLFHRTVNDQHLQAFLCIQMYMDR